MPTEVLHELRQMETDTFEVEELPSVDGELALAGSCSTTCSCLTGSTQSCTTVSCSG